MRELFIYYRVNTGRRDEVLAAVTAMQAQLRARHPQLVARLLQRDDLHAEFDTWMETYSTATTRDTQGVDLALQAEIAEAAWALLPLVDGPRHTEVFNPCVW